MKIKYSLQAEDYVAFQMLAAGRNPDLKAKMKRSRWVLSSLTFVVGVILAVKGHWIGASVYGAISIALYFSYPKYFRWRHLMHYRKWVNSKYAARFGQPATVEFSKRILVIDATTDAKLEWSGMDALIETSEHLFAMLSIGGAIILPKSTIDTSAVREVFIDNGVALAQSNGWDREF